MQGEVGKIQNAMTVDVEDYFQVSAFANNISRYDWDNMEARVVENTQRILDLFGSQNISATFFILGWVAERQPELVRSIISKGHEVACHGYSHQLVYEQTPEVFREETLRAKKILEDITGTAINGYRAASYSITEKSRWALDILFEAGFKYDSSIFPVRHDRYGIPGTPKLPHIIKTLKGNSIVEFPLSTSTLFGYVLPVSGGGYFRLYPYWVTRLFLNRINKSCEPFIFYLHPWEIDTEQPRIKTSVLSRFRHYNNLDKCENRLRRLLSDFEFTTVKSVLQGKDLLDK